MVGKMTEKNLIGQNVLLRISDPAELGLKFDFDFQGKVIDLLHQTGETTCLIVEVDPEMQNSWKNQSRFIIVDPRYEGENIFALLKQNILPLTVNFIGLKKWPFPANEPKPKNIFGQPLSPDAIFRQNTFGIGFGTIRLADTKVSQ